MRVVFLGRDLMIGSRIAEAAARADADLRRVDAPADLPPASDVDLLLVDWAEREPEWGSEIASWLDAGRPERPRLIVFGPHTDLDAHAAARAAGIGPMMARSKLVAFLNEILSQRNRPKSP